MSGFLVDTDWAIQVLHGSPEATQTLIDHAVEGLAVSFITYGERFEGAYYARDAQAALAALTAFLASKDLLPLTTAIMERFAILRGQLPRQHRQQIGDMDLLIAGTAIEHSLELFTTTAGISPSCPGSRHMRRTRPSRRASSRGIAGGSLVASATGYSSGRVSRPCRRRAEARPLDGYHRANSCVSLPASSPFGHDSRTLGVAITGPIPE